MKLRLTDFAEQAAEILAASKARRAEALMMADDDDFDVDDDNDEGGDPDDPDADDGKDSDDDSGDGDDEGGDDEPLLNDEGKPFTKKDLDALKLALRNARREARASRRKGGKPDADKDAKDGDKDGKDGDGPDTAAIRAEAENAAMATWKPIVVNERARAALKDAGLIGDPGRVLRLLDMDDIDVDLNDKGQVEVDGLTEQVEDLRKDYPHLFRRRRGSARIDAGDKDGDNDSGRRKTRSASEIQAAALLGRD